MQRTRSPISNEIVDWAQLGPIRSFINVLDVFNLIYSCYFTRSTPDLTKPIKNGRLGPNASFIVILSKFDRIYTCISLDQLPSILNLTNWLLGSNIDQQGPIASFSSKFIHLRANKCLLV